MISDALQIPLHISPRPEVGSRGAAMTAMKVIGIDFDEKAWTKPDGVIAPDKSMADHYGRGFGLYQDMLAAARPLWRSPFRA